MIRLYRSVARAITSRPKAPGLRFTLRSQGVPSLSVEQFEAKLEIRDGMSLWTVREIDDVNLSRVKALLDDGLSIQDIADETGLSKSTVHRLKKQIKRSRLRRPPRECPNHEKGRPQKG